MEALWKAVGDGSKSIVDAVVQTLLTVVSNPVFLFSLPAIYGMMYLVKQATPWLRKSKYHNLVYTILPPIIGIFYVASLHLFPQYFKVSFTWMQTVVLGIGLGIVNVLTYMGIKKWENRKKKPE